MNVYDHNENQPQHGTLVWVVDDDAIRWVLEKALNKAGYTCVSFENGAQVLDALKSSVTKPAVLLSDIKMPKLDGLSLLNAINEQQINLPLIIMTAFSDLDAAVSAYQNGAFDYIPKPFDIDEVLELVKRAILKNNSVDAPILPHSNDELNKLIIGEAPAMQEVFRIIGKLSKSSMSVLINGESGTGKELVAKALHT